MSRFRFTIGGILVVVLFLGVAIAALREANEAWDCSVFGLTLLTLLIALLLTVHRREASRAYWLGFVVFGGVYLGSSLVPSVAVRLPTTKLLTFLDSFVPGRPTSYTITLTTATTTTSAGSVGSPGPGSNVTTTLSGNPIVLNTVRALGPGQGGNPQMLALSGSGFFFSPSGSTENFVQIGHSLMALIAAVVGGGLSRRFFERGRRRADDPPGEREMGLEPGTSQ